LAAFGNGNSEVYLSKKSETRLKWTPAQLEARKKRLLGTKQYEVDQWVIEIKDEVQKNE